MQKENNLTVRQWCDRWFTSNRHKWNGNTEGGYRNLIYSHILPSIGSVALSDLTKQTITGFYNDLRNQGLQIGGENDMRKDWTTLVTTPSPSASTATSESRQILCSIPVPTMGASGFSRGTA